LLCRWKKGTGRTEVEESMVVLNNNPAPCGGKKPNVSGLTKNVCERPEKGGNFDGLGPKRAEIVVAIIKGGGPIGLPKGAWESGSPGRAHLQWWTRTVLCPSGGGAKGRRGCGGKIINYRQGCRLSSQGPRSKTLPFKRRVQQERKVVFWGEEKVMDGVACFRSKNRGRFGFCHAKGGEVETIKWNDFAAGENESGEGIGVNTKQAPAKGVRRTRKGGEQDKLERGELCKCAIHPKGKHLGWVVALNRRKEEIFTWVKSQKPPKKGPRTWREYGSS